MLTSLLTNERITIGTAVGWVDAVRVAAQPLVEDGSVELSYIEKIIENIAAPSGTYMDLGFGFTLAHARPEAGVNRTAVSLMVLEEPVLLADSPDHPVRVVVVLAAHAANDHQSTMAAIAKLLIDPDAREGLASARSSSDVQRVLASAE